MSYRVVKPPVRTQTASAVFLAAVVVLLTAALSAGWAATRPIGVVVDGVKRYVPSGSTIVDLGERHLLAGGSGRLVGIDGKVVRESGGDPPAVVRNGRACSLSQRVYVGDRIVSSPGANRRESLIVTDVAMPFETRYEGAGPLTELKALGQPGVRRVTMGEVSGIEVTSTVVRGPSDMIVLRLRPRGKVVAITFDDGPWPGQTEQVLAVLRREQVKATFFMVGKQVRSHPALARRVAREGHDIGNHTYSHMRLTRASAAKLRWEVRAGQREIARVTGHDVRWLRPPYGAMDPQAWDEARSLGARVVLWDVDSRDWTHPGVKNLEASVLRDVRPGSVVLFHDGGGDRRQTLWALPRVIRQLKERGYTFVTVDELAQLRAEKAAAARKASGRGRGSGRSGAGRG